MTAPDPERWVLYGGLSFLVIAVVACVVALVTGGA